MSRGELRDKGAGRTFKVGALAKATGTSVRTLHWYDELGLLSPSHHSRAGYRLYGEKDVARLQQILSLRHLGFSLDEIRAFLARSDVSPLSVVRMHIERLRDQVEETRKLLGRLEAIEGRLAESEPVSVDELLKTIEVMNMIEKYYTKEQLAELSARREALGEETIKAVEAEWPALIAQVRAEMDKGTPVEDAGVQALAKRWNALVEMFTGGDPGIQRSLSALHANEPGHSAQMGLDPALFDYVRRASAAGEGGA